MGKTLLYLSTLIAVIAVVVYLNLMKPLGQELVTPVEESVSQLSKKISKVVVNEAETVDDQVEIVDTTETPVVAATEAPAVAQVEAQPLDSPDVLPSAEAPTQEVAALDVTQAAATIPDDAVKATNNNNTTSTTRVLLIPDRETTIASTIAGRIIGLKGSLGQRFNKGAVLVSFDCNQSYARVEIAKAELAGAIEQHEAKVKMQGLDQASDVEVALAASAANKAKAELKLNRTIVSECRIYAPWSGRVAKAHVKKSMTVNAGDPLLEIVNTGPLKLKLNIPSNLLSEIKIGAKFDVMIDETGKSYSASVKAINSRIDPVSQTVEIEAKMDKAHTELLAGMSGTADFTGLGIYQ